jgi:hypothetical protein
MPQPEFRPVLVTQGDAILGHYRLSTSTIQIYEEHY